MTLYNFIFYVLLKSPLEQFEVYSFDKSFFFEYNKLYLPYLIFNNNVEFLLFLICAFIILSFSLNVEVFTINNVSYLKYQIFKFVATLFDENAKPYARIYFPLIYILFLFILVANLFGLIPYSFTITSSFMAIFFLSLSYFIGLMIIAISTHRSEFAGFFLPGGSPLLISPFLVIIELISFTARLFSLTIRLFANMMAGHTLLKILAGFSWTIFMSYLSWLSIIGGLVPFIIVFIVLYLELAIAFLQAYVFTVLISVYLNDALVNGH